jgi:hypothetical protein
MVDKKTRGYNRRKRRRKEEKINKKVEIKGKRVDVKYLASSRTASPSLQDTIQGRENNIGQRQHWQQGTSC